MGRRGTERARARLAGGSEEACFLWSLTFALPGGKGSVVKGGAGIQTQTLLRPLGVCRCQKERFIPTESPLSAPGAPQGSEKVAPLASSTFPFKSKPDSGRGNVP